MTCSSGEEELQSAHQMHVGAPPHTTTRLTYSGSRAQNQKPASSISQPDLAQCFTDSFPATHKNWMGWAIEEIPLSMGLKQQAWFFGS